jgi:hypothetical protein
MSEELKFRINRMRILEIPRKNQFSNLDNENWKLASVDFMPFEHQDDFAENINKICSLTDDEDLLDTLTKAKLFACSTIILNSEGVCQRVFFESPKDLENFLINYQENEKL